jgi:hypothetical protein
MTLLQISLQSNAVVTETLSRSGHLQRRASRSDLTSLPEVEAAAGPHDDEERKEPDPEQELEKRVVELDRPRPEQYGGLVVGGVRGNGMCVN